MTRRRRTRILVEGAESIREQLSAEICGRYEVVDLAAPNDGLVMVSVREPARRSRFFLGEVLVTEAKVQIEGVTGLGIIAGERQEDARRLAIIDAAFNANLPETVEWLEILEDEERRILADAGREFARVLETRVSFETMDVD